MAKFSLFNFICMLVLIAGATASPTGRIVGGDDAAEGQFPHQISLMLHGSHHCGGSIISHNFILTAAHCITSNNEDGSLSVSAIEDVTIRAGSTNRVSGGVVVGISKIIVHEMFVALIDDVALLQLKTSLVYSSNVQPIALASAVVPDGKKVIISGWGYLESGGNLANQLQYNTLEAMSKEECLASLNVSDAIICLAHESNNGACGGDSGGPATYNGELVGVAAFVVNGCGSTYPDGYGNVFYHADWIKEHSDL